jgi:hypothetical protein
MTSPFIDGLKAIRIVSANGANQVQVTAGGQLQITGSGGTIFYDPFDGTVLDIVNRWSPPVLAGTGTVTVNNGSCILSTGTTASNAATLFSQENFIAQGQGQLLGGGFLVPLGSPGLNTNLFLGNGTPGPGGGVVAATPITDGYGWEYDIAGTFGFSVYNSGTRIYRALQDQNGRPFIPPTAGTPIVVDYQYAPNQIFCSYGLGNLEEPSLIVQGFQPAVSNLPLRFALINHTSGPATAQSWLSAATVMIDTSTGVPPTFNGQSVSRLRSPGKFIPLNAVGIATETTIWTPAAGRKFRLMGYVLTSGTAAGNVVLKDNTAGTSLPIILPFSAVGQTIAVLPPGMGNGILSATAGNLLTATGVATQTLSGYLIGCEE